MRGIVAVGAVLAITASNAGAMSHRERTVERTYLASHGLNVAGEAEVHVDESKLEPLTFRSRRGETRVSVRVEDVTGQRVRGHAHVDADADGVFEKVFDFCGRTPKPISLRSAGAVVTVAPLAGMCDDGSPSMPTRGSVITKFSE